jgi:hypothetical protein
MLTITLGLALTLVLVARAVTVGARQSLDMGTMSPQWIIVHHASQPSSSI